MSDYKIEYENVTKYKTPYYKSICIQVQYLYVNYFYKIICN